VGAAFFEAIRSLTQPCTLLFIVPTLAIVVAAAAHWYALAAAIVAAVVGGWALVGNWWFLEGLGLRVAGAVYAVVVVALAISRTGLRSVGEAHPALAGSGVAGGTLLAAAWWRPCVGEHLGLILDGTRGAGHQLPAMAAYMLGLMLPVVAVGFLHQLGEHERRPANWARSMAAMLGAAIGLALVGGMHDDLVVVLSRWTTT
jgi:hypothetical protein